MNINDPIDSLMAYILICGIIAFITAMIWMLTQKWKEYNYNKKFRI